MALRPVLSRLAEADLARAYEWSRARHPSRAGEFRRALRTALNQICEAPSRWRIWQPPDYRRWLMNPYPYMIIDHVTDTTVVLDAIPHMRQNPDTLLIPEDP